MPFGTTGKMLLTRFQSALKMKKPPQIEAAFRG